MFRFVNTFVYARTGRSRPFNVSFSVISVLLPLLLVFAAGCQGGPDHSSSERHQGNDPESTSEAPATSDESQHHPNIIWFISEDMSPDLGVCEERSAVYAGVRRTSAVFPEPLGAGDRHVRHQY